MWKLISSWCVLLSGCLVVGPLPAAEWGDLTATFVFDGAVPDRPHANVTADKEFCGKFQLLDESLIVNEKNGGIANVVVRIAVGRGDAKPAVHESYLEAQKADVLLDNCKCRFAPHIVFLRPSQTLLAGNSDDVAHNVNLMTFDNPQQNLLITPGDQIKLTYALPERFPRQVSCNIHPWMKAWLFVEELPYLGISDENGRLEIKNLPEGEWQFHAWHERGGHLREIGFGAATSSSRGLFKASVKSGQNDLGKIKLKPEFFKR